MAPARDLAMHPILPTSAAAQCVVCSRLLGTEAHTPVADDNGAFGLARVSSAGAVRADDAGGAGGARRPGLLRVRRLAGGQRQQQLPDHDGARRLVALRHRHPGPPRHRPLLQRQERARPHQREPWVRAGAAVPEPPSGRREAARRRQLRLRRHRDPQRHRHPIRQHHPDLEAADLLRAVPAPAGQTVRPRPGGPRRRRRADPHHARRQRLREQLLPGALLRPLPRVLPPGLHQVHPLRVQAGAPPHPRPGRQPHPRHRRRPHRVRARRARPPQHRRPLRPGAAARLRGLQPAAGDHARRAQRRGRRRQRERRGLRRGEHQAHARRLHRRPERLRVRHRHPRLLRPGPLQRDRHLHHGVAALRQPRRVRVLGRLPPHGARQPAHRAAVHVREHRVHLPHEPLHHHPPRPPPPRLIDP